MGVGLYAVLFLNQWRWGFHIFDINPYLWKAIFLMFLEFMVITAVAILFSSFSSSSTLSAIFTLAVYLIGHLTEELKLIGEKSHNLVLESTMDFVYYVLPNLDNFNVKGRIVHGLAVPADYMLSVTAYGLLYVASVLFAAVVIFQKRDFR
jgi:hypothetical protein